MPPHSLSKTSFLKFEQCPKAFFLYRNLPYLRDKPSAEKEITFRRGHDVGFLAQQLFPGGRDVSKETSGAEEALAVTAQLISEKQPVIYEATFMFNGVLVMIDILCLNGDRYTAYEVKSSLRVSEFFMRDACLQYYVLKQALPGFEDLYLVTMNPEYVKQGEVDVKKLFRKRSIRAKAELNFSYFDLQVKAALLVLEQNVVPNIPVGPQCFRPYQCDFFGNCWKEELGPNSVFHFPFTSKETQFEWHRTGIRLIDQVPDEALQKESLLRIRNSIVLQEPFFDLDAIRKFLLRVQQPVCAMDMEIWNAAVPELDGTGPFEQIPFLAGFYSDGQESHHFAPYADDEREVFAHALISLSTPYATVLVYDKNLEVIVINALISRFPHLAEGLNSLLQKLVDVQETFVKMQYYHPAFRNSFSLKTVSAVLLGDMAYGQIVSGLEAMNFFSQYRGENNPIKKEELKSTLLHYCITDCRATLGLYQFLENLLRSKVPA